jgi:hypothetical protein
MLKLCKNAAKTMTPVRAGRTVYGLMRQRKFQPLLARSKNSELEAG